MPRFRIIGSILTSLLLFAPMTFAADDAVAKAIEGGAKYLRYVHQPSQFYTGGSSNFGGAALCGLALLESGVGLDDPSLQNINKFVRLEAIRQVKTYEIALAIMYLDRIGERADRPIIQFLGLRLIAGQSFAGHWAYDCGRPLQADEEQRLRTAIANDTHLAPKDGPIGPNAPPASKKDRPAPPNADSTALHPGVVQAAKLISVQDQVVGMFVGDNSNTQFAALALWISRKYGVPCDAALGGLAKSFRAKQGRDGGWSYDPLGGAGSSPTMTCAGLIGLGVGHGAQMSALRTGGSKTSGGTGGAPADKDASIKAAIKLLAAYINLAKTRNAASGGKRKLDELNQNLYLLWSLERVAVIYDLDRFGDQDWYAWGAEALLENQNADGSWKLDGFQGSTQEINTAFALLFLNRANLAKDLTATLRGKASSDVKLPTRVTDPEPVKVEPKQSTPRVAAEFDNEADRLANSLATANASSRGGIVKQLRDTKGSVYTEALARAIPKLQGEAQREAREALAARLKRMTANTLRDMLKDENPEIRGASAAACGLKEDKRYIPDLIGLLTDNESLVVQSARTSLRNLSAKDFGPPPEATAPEKTRSAAAWRTWWNGQQK